MPENNQTSLRVLLEQMTTAQLDEMLNTELEKENPDGNAVRLILDILHGREKDYPVELTPGMERAWESYQERISQIRQEETRHLRRDTRALRRLAAVAVLVLLLMAVVPKPAQAENLWQKLARWSDSIFEFFTPNAPEVEAEPYEFRTDNPGLQQVYDAVVELGITEPVVPMWIPEGYELVEIKTISTPAKVCIHARFSNDSSEILINIDVSQSDAVQTYYKDATPVDRFEKNGMAYNVIQNNEFWIAIGLKDHVECFLAVDCQEGTLYQVLESIYTMEEKS